MLKAIVFVAFAGGGLALDALIACRNVQSAPQTEPASSAVEVTVKVIPGVVGGGINAVVTTTPDDHFAAGPHGRVTASGRGRVGACPSPTVVGAGRRWRHAVSPTGVQRAALISSAPDDHFIASPHCCGNGSAGRRAGSADGCPTVGNGIISSTGVQIGEAAVISTPDDHFAAGPYCRVIFSASGRVGGTGGCPRVVSDIIPQAGV